MFRSDLRLSKTSLTFEDKHYSHKRRSIRSLRKLVEVLDQRHSNISIIGLLIHTAMETVSVALYAWTSEISKATDVGHFRWPLAAFIVEVVLNIIFFCEWAALFFFEADKKRYLVSWLSLVNVMTSVPMITLGIGALADSRWRHWWVPMYLRVWWMNDCLWVLVDYRQVACMMEDIYREMLRFFFRLFAIMATCIGTIQIVESCTGRYLDLYDSTYLIVVAFGTIGYGDYYVTSTGARLIMTVFVIIGVCSFIPLLSRLGEIGDMRLYYERYHREWYGVRREHVIICGLFNDIAVDVLLRNFYAGWRKYLNTNIILMCPVEHSDEVKLTANWPWFKTRVKLMIGDPANAKDLLRADARHADAIFLFGNTTSSAYFHDFNIVAQAMAVSLFDPELPQHILLRRGRSVKQVAPYAASVLEIERTVHNLLGQALVVPGVIPLVVNLMRTYEPMPLDVTLGRSWVEQYEYALRNDLHSVEVPDALRGREFRVLARAFFEHDVTLAGILNVHNVVQLNPRELIPNAKKLIMLAQSMRAATETTAEVSRFYEQTFGEEMLTAPDPDMMEHKPRAAPPPVARGVAAPAPSSSDNMPHDSLFSNRSSDPVEASDDLEDSATLDSEASAGQPASMLERIPNAFDYEGHYIIIDLSAAVSKGKETRYAQESSLMMSAHDMYHVMSPVNQSRPESDIVLLTIDVAYFNYFNFYWRHQTSAKPVKYIVGCGLNTADLQLCNFQRCAGCCVFYASDIGRGGSTSAMSLLVVQSITDLLQGTPAFPLVVELTKLGTLPLLPPYAEDIRLRSKADVDFVFEPNYFMGNAISRLMFYPALQRTYFMSEFIEVVDVLLSGHSANTPALAYMSLTACEAELDTYEDVINYCLKLGFVPLALHRQVLDTRNSSISGQRFVLTNPPRGLPVQQKSDALIYLTPGL